MSLGEFGKGIKDGGGYDLNEITMAEEALAGGKGVKEADLQEVEPMYIEVIPHDMVHHTEEYEARMVIIEYDKFNRIIGVELL